VTELAIRYSTNIQADIKRGWSGWMGEYDKLSDAVELVVNETILDELWNDSEVLIKEFGEDFENYDDLIKALHAEYLSNLILYDENAQAWRIWHHDGLACYAVTSEPEGQELAQRLVAPCGNGDTTEGKVEVIKDLGDGWWLLRCDSTWSEPDGSGWERPSFLDWLERRYN